MKAALKAKGYFVQPFVGYKYDLNTAGDLGRLTQTCEYAVFRVFCGQDAPHHHMSMRKDPIRRHNIVIDLLLQELFKYSTLAGTVIVNQNEKPEYVVQALLGPFPQAW